MFEEKVKNFRIITVLASSFYVSDDLFDDVKYIVSAYKTEIEESVGINKKKKSRKRKTSSSKSKTAVKTAKISEIKENDKFSEDTFYSD